MTARPAPVAISTSTRLTLFGRPETGYERVLEDLGAWIIEQRSFPLVSRAQETLLNDIGAIQRKRERLLAPLNIVLAGGTGVGKSSLLNALAGTVISEAAEIRAFTRDYTCYYHEDDALAVRHELLGTGHTVAHDRDELRDKIIVDTPDFDSAEASHRAKLHTALEHADLVIWVTTQQKYADLSGIEVLKEYREGRHYVFVLNRDDQDVGDAVVEDLRGMLSAEGFETPRIFRVSAHGILQQKQGRPNAVSGRDDLALEAFIEKELSDKRIRMLKRGNLARLVLRLIAEIRERLPEDLRVLLQRWRERGDSEYGELRGSMRVRIVETLSANRTFVRQLRYRFAATYGGLFGAWLQFIYAARAVADLDYPDLFGRREGRAALPQIHRGEDGLAADVHEIHDLYRRIETGGRELGLTAEVTSARPEAADVERSLRRFYDRVDAGFLHELDEVAETSTRALSGRALNTVLNLLPLGWLVFLLIFWVDVHFTRLLSDRQDVGQGYFTAGLLVCLFILILCQRVAERRIDARVSAVLERADSIVAEALDATVQSDVFKARDECIERTTEELDELDILESRAQSLQRGHATPS